MSFTAVRWDLVNATHCPSGEKRGKKSPPDCGGDVVSLRLSPVSNEMRKMDIGPFGRSESVNASSLPSIDHAVDKCHTVVLVRLASLRSAPPRDGTVIRLLPSGT